MVTVLLLSQSLQLVIYNILKSIQFTCCEHVICVQPHTDYQIGLLNITTVANLSCWHIKNQRWPYLLYGVDSISELGPLQRMLTFG